MSTQLTHTEEKKMDRTDLHRPSTIVPADYHYMFSYSLATTQDQWPIPSYNVDVYVAHRADMRGAHRSPGRCDVCGANFIYGEVWKHEPSGDLISLGHECAHKYDLHADTVTYEMGRKGHVAKAIREARKAAARELMEKQLAETPGLGDALKTDHYIVEDIRGRFEETGHLSEKQVELVFKLSRDAQAKAERDAAHSVPVPEMDKRVTVEGEVVHTRWEDNGYGGCVKMLLKVYAEGDSYFKLWGTMPSLLANMGAQKGSRVRFVARTQRSDKDECFGFFSRPTKPELLNGCEECGQRLGNNWHSCEKCRAHQNAEQQKRHAQEVRSSNLQMAVPDEVDPSAEERDDWTALFDRTFEVVSKVRGVDIGTLYLALPELSREQANYTIREALSHLSQLEQQADADRKECQ